jgi:hypothetical protein
MILNQLFVRFPFIFQGCFVLFFLDDLSICVNESASGCVASPYGLRSCTSWVYHVGSLGQQPELQPELQDYLFL